MEPKVLISNKVKLLKSSVSNINIKNIDIYLYYNNKSIMI